MLITGVIEKDPASGVHSVDFRYNYDWELPDTSGGTTPLPLYAINLLKPSRTAALTSRRYILHIYSTNIP